MATPNKQRLVAKLLAHLAKLYPDELPKEATVLDHMLLGVVQEETPFAAAMEAYRRLRVAFPDVNELRVSHRNEIVEQLADVPDAPEKARRILQILQFIFETTYAFDLESMRKKPLKQAQKQLSKISGTTPFVVAAVVQR
ncbi:MAG: hypothetical protein ACRDD1_06550, partial [Planctomycetia bacterium]